MRRVCVFMLAVLGTGALCGCRTPESGQTTDGEVGWRQNYIGRVPPILMRDPLLEMLGQTGGPIPYTYEEAVKLTGHSCMVVAAAWSMTRKALAALYPEGEVPVRGQVRIQAPGAEDEWNIGVMASVLGYVTGAVSESGFSGSAFGRGNESAIRRNKMVFPVEHKNTPPPLMQWIFVRTDNGKRVAAKWDIRRVQPPLSEERIAIPGMALAAGRLSPEERSAFVKDWNAAAVFVLENADAVDGMITVEPLP